MSENTIHSEVGFKKSSYSSGGQNCVEFSHPVSVGDIAIRDSKVPDGPVLTFPGDVWASFNTGIRRGQLP